MPRDTLDEFFGPKRIQNVHKSVQNVYNWRCEDNLKPLLDGYMEYVTKNIGDIDLSPRLRQEWYAAGRVLREDLYSYHIPEREWKEFVLWACKQMKKRGLDNKNLRSIKFLVPRWQAKKKKEDTSKYLKGWFDD